MLLGESLDLTNYLSVAAQTKGRDKTEDGGSLLPSLERRVRE